MSQDQRIFNLARETYARYIPHLRAALPHSLAAALGGALAGPAGAPMGVAILTLIQLLISVLPYFRGNPVLQHLTSVLAAVLHYFLQRQGNQNQGLLEH